MQKNSEIFKNTQKYTQKETVKKRKTHQIFLLG